MIKAYIHQDAATELNEGDVVFLGKHGNGNNLSGAYHFCSPLPLQTNGNPHTEVLHGWLGSFNNVPSYASGKARIVAGPFIGDDARAGDAYYLVRRCADSTPGTHGNI